MKVNKKAQVVLAKLNDLLKKIDKAIETKASNLPALEQQEEVLKSELAELLKIK